MTLLLFSLACALSAASRSCTARRLDPGKVLLTYTRWGTPSELESTRELIAQFERENPDVQVRVDVVSWTQYWQKMKTATVTNSAQDVWLMSPAFIEEYASAGHLLDLMPFVKADPAFNLDDYFPRAFNDFSFEVDGENLRPVPFGQGKLFAFTRDYNCSFLFYNKDHFDALGLAYPTADWTWDDLLAAAKMLTIDFDNDGVIDQWGYGGLNYGALAGATGAIALDVPNRRSNFSSPEMRKVMAFCQDLIYKYKVHPPPTIRIDETESFVTGKISMTAAGIWNIRAFSRSECRWDIAPVPVDIRGRQRFAPAGGVAHCISARCPHPREAWRLVKFLSSDPGQLALARSGTSIPVLKRAAMSDQFLADFQYAPKSSYPVIFKTLDNPSLPRSYARGYMQYTRAIGQVTDLIWRNQVTADEGCRRIDAAVDAILAEQYRLPSGRTTP